MTSRYDVAEHLRTPEEMAAYFEACFEEAEGDAAFIAKALGDIARAKGMAQVARDAGLSRESLYKALSGERSPDFETILKVVSALGLELRAKVDRERDASSKMTGRSFRNRPGKLLHRAVPNSAVEADVALGRCASSGPRSITPVVMQTLVLTRARSRGLDELPDCCGNVELVKGCVGYPVTDRCAPRA